MKSLWNERTKRSHSTFRWNEISKKKCLSEWENWWWWDEGEGWMRGVANSGRWREIWAFFILYVAACPIIMDDDVTNGRPVVGRMDSLETCATLNKHFVRFSRYLNIFIIDNRNLSVFFWWNWVSSSTVIRLFWELCVYELWQRRNITSCLNHSTYSRRVCKCSILSMSTEWGKILNKNAFRVFPPHSRFRVLNTKCH